jgi:hypothetical protein
MNLKPFFLNLPFLSRDCRNSFTTLSLKPLPEWPAVVLLWGRHLAFLVFAPHERGGHDDLRGSSCLSVISYVHGRTELHFCLSLSCLRLFCLFDPLKIALARAFYSSMSGSYNESSRPDRWPRGR